MRFPFLPTLIADSVTDLTPELLYSRGIRLLMLDFDNTIVPYTTNEPTDPMSAWLEMMKASNIQICVLSNSHKERVKIFCSARGIDCITHANKPFSKGIRQCMEQYELSGRQCALAGDQIYTDILGANCAGIQSVLVKAIHNHTFLLKARHVLEIPWILAAKNRKLDADFFEKR